MDQKDNKCWQQITEEERYKIEGWLQAKLSEGEIANLLGKHKRMIRREIAMVSVLQRDSELREKKVYKADYAQTIHDRRAENKGATIKLVKLTI